MTYNTDVLVGSKLGRVKCSDSVRLSLTSCASIIRLTNVFVPYLVLKSFWGLT